MRQPTAPSAAAYLRRCALLLGMLGMLAGSLLIACSGRDGEGGRLVIPEVVRTHVYVAPGGNDSDPGTSAEPFRTLARAAQVATSGTTVHVAPGVYSGGVRSTAHGTREARILFQSSARWGARIVPPLDARQTSAWDNLGDHVDIVGFEIDGAQYQSGARWLNGIRVAGAHNGVHHNRIHHIGIDPPCEDRGGAGIAVDTVRAAVGAALSGNTVHDIGPPACPSMHGIKAPGAARLHDNTVYAVAGDPVHLRQDGG